MTGSRLVLKAGMAVLWACHAAWAGETAEASRRLEIAGVGTTAAAGAVETVSTYRLSGGQMAFMLEEIYLPEGTHAWPVLPGERVLSPIDGHVVVAASDDGRSARIVDIRLTSKGPVMQWRSSENESFVIGDVTFAYPGEHTGTFSSGMFEDRPVFGLDGRSIRLVLEGDDSFRLEGEVTIDSTFAQELGVGEASGEAIGEVRIESNKLTLVSRGRETPPADDGGPSAAGVIGPDVIVSTVGSVPNPPALGTLSKYGTVSGITGYSMTTVSCNLGDTPAIWIDTAAEAALFPGYDRHDHPVISQTMYRFRSVSGSNRFEQIGMAWLKHGFCGADAPGANCGTCSTPGPNGCNDLGVGCTDTYCAGLNGSQSGLGPRSEINPWTADFPYPYVLNWQLTGDAIYKRLQIKNTDLDPAQNSGAQYLAEAQYIVTDEAAAQRYNNVSRRGVTVGTFSGGGYNLAFTGPSNTTVPQQTAIQAWPTLESGVTLSNIDVTNDGRLMFGYKVTSLGGGQYHYEYAVYNMNCDRAVQSFSVPVPSGVTVTNVGFHDVDYHSGEPYSLTDWSSNLSGGSLTWSTQTHTANPNANALRWSTTYNFRFDANAAPTSATASMNLFKPGTPTGVTAPTQAPSGTPSDCNSNGVADNLDIANGTSLDCNGNSVPDECDTFPPVTLGVQLLASGFGSPVFVCSPPGDTTRLFVVEQNGLIKIRDLVGNTTLATPFLDVTALSSCCGERGLLGLAFHPNYASNGFFYLNYTNNSGHTVIARYTVSGNPNVANAASALILKTINQDFANHNGGCLQFGPDGYLYVGMGDGGSADDPNGRAQDTGQLLGKMLRLDVDDATAPIDYVPPTNPFVGAGNPLDEIWAIGMRNPWRFSFDRLTGDLYIADVGQGSREEIDFEPAGFAGGRNYGWRCMEGTECTGLTGCTCNAPSLTLPILEYSHAVGASVSGGVVYRGCVIPSISGRYFYGDYVADFIKSFEYVGGSVTNQQDHTAAFGNIGAPVSFGEDAVGEVYIVSYFGSIYKIVPITPPVCGNGVVEAGEQCDDSNTNNGDGCSSTCQNEGGGGDNNSCSGATAVCTGTFNDSTSTATQDGTASCGDTATTPDVWFAYTPNANGTLNVNTCGSNDLGGTDAGMDTVLSIHSACVGTSGNQLACNDDWPSGGAPANACSGTDAGSGRDSAVSIAVTSGTTYYIRASGWNGSVGDFVLNVSGPTCPVANDCNGNLIDDAQDIASGTSLDCDLSGVPDECETAKQYTITVTPPLAIPDATVAHTAGTTVSNSFTVPDSGTIVDLNVDLAVTHTWNGDLWVRLVHGGTAVVLIDRPGMVTPPAQGSNDNGYNIILDDEGTGGAIENINLAGASGTPVSPPSYTPNQALSAFDGLEKSGLWTIELNDWFPADTGTLTTWSLHFVNEAPECLQDCNANTIDDADDILGGTSDDCQPNGVPDECDTGRVTSPWPCDPMGTTSMDCDGGPVGVAAGGSTIFSTSCFGCHNTNGQGGSGGGCGGTCPGPNLRNKCRVQIWDMLLPPTDHPGGAHPEYSQQDFANLEAFLDDGGSRGRPDTVPDECQTLADCDTDGTPDGCELERGTQVDVDYDGVPDNCEGCQDNGDCDDGLFCNGAETCNLGTGQCQAGSAPNCSDGISCTLDSCNEGTDSCDHVPNNGACGDGLFCNGSEVCNATTGCQAGTPPNCNDAVSCTVDSCNETTDQCVHTPNNGACGDGLFCNGSEVCNVTAGCQAGTPPNCADAVSCTVDSCNEGTDSCDHVPNNGACGDGLFCNGSEVCNVTAGCQAGTPPNCADSVSCTVDACNEGTDQCDHTPNHAACGDGVFCNGAETCHATLGCQAGSNPCTGGLVCDEPDDACVECLLDPDCGAGEVCQNEQCVPDGGCTTGSQCDDATLCTYDTCDGGSCSNSSFEYGDVNDDGAVNADDVLCELDEFGGNPNSPSCLGMPFGRKDIAPCPQPGDPNNLGDTFVNLDDALAVSNAFAGTPACACGGPSPASAPTTLRRASRASAASAATLWLVPDHRVVRPGGEVTVDVYVSGVADLRAYQLTMTVGGRTGTMSIQDVSVDEDREDYALAGLETLMAVNHERGRMLNALPAGGVDARAPAYLATFVLRVPTDARGAVVLTLGADGESLLRDSRSEVLGFRAPSSVIVVAGPAQGR